MKPFFTPEDFAYTHTDEEKADTANTKLKKLIEAAPVVYGVKNDEGIFEFTIDEQKYDTVVGKVMFIEPIVKECEEHIPKLLSKQPVGLPSCDDRYGAALMLGCSIVCSKCGKTLKATWEAVK